MERHLKVSTSPFGGDRLRGLPLGAKKRAPPTPSRKWLTKMFFAPSGETPWPITPERGHSSEWKGPLSYAANRVPISLSIPEKIVTKMLVKGDSVDRYGSEWYGWKGHSILYNSAIYTIWLSWTVFEIQAPPFFENCNPTPRPTCTDRPQKFTECCHPQSLSMFKFCLTSDYPSTRYVRYKKSHWLVEKIFNPHHTAPLGGIALKIGDARTELPLYRMHQTACRSA